MTSLYYYDAFDYEYEMWEANMTNTTKLYNFEQIVCTFIDMIIHLLVYVFGFMYVFGLMVITLLIVTLPFTVSLTMCLAIMWNWNGETPSRRHSDRNI